MGGQSLAGWLWNGERLVPDDSVSGCLHRGMELTGRCWGGDCTRRLTVDLHAWSSMGYSKMHIQELRGHYECRRQPECGLRWSETYPKGLPLQLYVGDAGVELQVQCDACKFAKAYDALALIRRLSLSGLGDGNLGVNVAGRAIRGQCSHCGARKWAVRAVREDPVAVMQRGSKAT